MDWGGILLVGLGGLGLGFLFAAVVCCRSQKFVEWLRKDKDW